MNREDLGVELSKSVVKAACKLWAGPAGTVVETFVDLTGSQIRGRLEQRRAERFFESCVDIVAKRTLEVLGKRAIHIPENEVAAAISAVRDVVEKADLSRLIDLNLDARLIERQFARSESELLSRASLSDKGINLYRLILRESCNHMIELVSSLPDFQTKAFTELLKRDAAILSTLERVLQALPIRRNFEDFNTDYLRIVYDRFDRMELLGAGLSPEASRQYPLTVAYVSISAVRFGHPVLDETFRNERDRSVSAPVAGEVQIEEILGGERKILVLGDAGSGKTTLLHWLAVQSARSSFMSDMAEWNECVPFYIPLRNYVGVDLPAPELFVADVARNIMNEMPKSWVHNLLRSGRALVLIDGVDELPDGTQREDARKWLSELVSTFPNSRYVVTSRPAAVDIGWLWNNRFATVEMQPMSIARVRMFVEHWHNAISVGIKGRRERDALHSDQIALLATIESDKYVRALCVNPLLSALLCALNRERRGHLPRDRMGVYRAALEMLLDLRDRARKVTSMPDMNYTDKLTLVQDVAYYLVKNKMIDASAERVASQVGRTLTRLHHVKADQEVVFKALLERSGLLRTPAVGRVDFVHRSFQEYLAGKAAVDGDEIRYLLSVASDDQMRDVIVMAAGHAQSRQKEELLTGLLLGDPHLLFESPTDANKRRLLAVACLQTCRDLQPNLMNAIEQQARQLVPPDSVADASLLASVGPVVIDLIRERPPQNSKQAIASIRVAALVGGTDAIDLVAEIAATHNGVDEEVINSWSFFDAEEYASKVLPTARSTGRLIIADLGLLPLVEHFQALSEVVVRTTEFSILHELPPSPPNVCKLRINGGHVRTLRGLEKWSRVTYLDIDLGGEMLDLETIALACPQLQHLRLASLQRNPIDLAPLAVMANLSEIQLSVPHTDHVRLRKLPLGNMVKLTLPPGVHTSKRGVSESPLEVLRATNAPASW